MKQKKIHITIIPITLRQASAFIDKHHRHNKPPRGMKFAIGAQVKRKLVGVAVAGRPSARALDDGLTLEITRTCTDGTFNANSALYGACTRAAKAMGYRKMVTYTQADESGASLLAVGWIVEADLPARKSWAESSGKSKVKRDPIGNGGVPRKRWVRVLKAKGEIK